MEVWSLSFVRYRDFKALFQARPALRGNGLSGLCLKRAPFAWQAATHFDKLGGTRVKRWSRRVPAGPKPPGAEKRGVPKALSNPSSTGSAGPAFEVQVQAAFVVALATGGFIPAVPPWPVLEVRLQSGILGYKTDDFLVTVKHPVSDERVRLLGQIKL